MQQLWRLPAVTAVDMLQKQQVTPLQLVEASEARWKVKQQFQKTNCRRSHNAIPLLLRAAVAATMAVLL
jgi:hypothetical protein